MKKSLLFALAAAGITQTPGLQAAITVQELFDAMGADVAIGGQGGNASSVGLTGTWVQNAGGTIISTANNFNVQPLPGLSPQQSALGGVWKGGGGDWNTGIWATRPMAATIDLNSNSTFYFSVRLNNTGDTAAGFGFASGSAASSEYVGVGTHWNSHTDLGGAQARNSLYSSWGTLDQNLAGNNDGPYAMRAHTAADSVNGRALVVGRLTTSSSGNDVMDLKLYFNGDTIDNDLGTISWSLSDSFNSSMNASHLLLWMNGSGNGELDAIRVGQTWEDVTGVVLIPEPSVSLLGALSLLGLLRRRRS
ncbi:MAG: hypothetical protein KA004_02650 [Verrucomicrobiales bacterium]|nr:hypothetical protein [Verrucomicrobiales bacterium]